MLCEREVVNRNLMRQTEERNILFLAEQGGSLMQYHNTSTSRRVWQESGHASLCLLGVHVRRMNFFQPLEAHVQIEQKVLKYTPVQKLEMFLVGVLNASNKELRNRHSQE
jgi:hypothetical protein